MPRLYAKFPGGAPGAGMLLLRLAVGAILLAHAVFIAQLRGTGVSVLIGEVLAVSSGLALMAGFLTIAASLSGIFVAAAAFLWVSVSHSAGAEIKTSALGVLIMAAAISLTGPGAFSIDARLFGRRKIIIPRLSAISNVVDKG